MTGEEYLITISPKILILTIVAVTGVFCVEEVTTVRLDRFYYYFS